MRIILYSRYTAIFQGSSIGVQFVCSDDDRGMVLPSLPGLVESGAALLHAAHFVGKDFVTAGGLQVVKL